MLRFATVSAIALTAAVPALAQQTTETSRTTTTDPTTATQTTTETTTTAKPVMDATGAAATETRTKKKTKVKTDGNAMQPSSTTTTTSNTQQTTPAASAEGAAAVSADTAVPAAAATPPAAATSATTAAPAGSVAAPGSTTIPAAGATAPATAAVSATTTPNPTVGGAAMAATNNVVQNASAAPNLTTLVGLVTAADLATTLSGPGPFTVFAPTNDAFGRVAQVTRDALAKPEAKPQLQRVLKYHVVPGTLTLADLKAKAAAGGTLTTVEGQNLTVKVVAAAGGEAIELTDANGNKSFVETPDVRQSNGIVHVVNGVMFPKLS